MPTTCSSKILQGIQRLRFLLWLSLMLQFNQIFGLLMTQRVYVSCEKLVRQSLGRQTATNLAWGVSQHYRLIYYLTNRNLLRSLNVHSAYGAVVNPLSPEGEARSAGGSSGGSAAAVAARMCFAYVFLSCFILSSITVSEPARLGRTQEGQYVSLPPIAESSGSSHHTG
jgi:hypothetical protein